MLPNSIVSLAQADGNYISPPTTPNVVARLFPSVSFYSMFVYNVYKFGMQAKAGKYDDLGWYQSSLAVMRALEKAGANIQISGLNVLNQISGPCVIVANHMSTLETIILPGIVQPLKDVTFVVKRAIVEYPVFKHMMLTRDPIVVDRVNPREDLKRVLTEGAAQLARGRSVIVFPQTTRTVTFDPAHFNTIGIKLAREAGVPIVPVAVRSDAWGIGKWIKEFGKVDVSLPVRFAFGQPLTVEGRGNSTHHAVIHYISEHLQSWGCTVVTPSATDNSEKSAPGSATSATESNSKAGTEPVATSTINR
jgi:1-acyl-sn-glycerol-3-phosphate acyltransferase